MAFVVVDLPAPFRPYQSDDLAAADLERQVVQRSAPLAMGRREGFST